MQTEDDTASSAQKLTYRAAENGSAALKKAVRAAIQRQAFRWNITNDQAQVLLLDRRMPA